ncbi:GGDEF domain-containing protein [Clostridium sp. D2Q-11]|uniref:GGDEF domain-containing protein n=1 Tax=Anaeromonas frigoriresistens TaxID=2683708 RepID=A0A942UWT7_9FIRM|nr:GGDEF domain-containing protein [Anaeromonas frigoriresistens]MBS4538264.1 GGDEF domain-containing protein [Anaeromonas frigoriresistens]
MDIKIEQLNKQGTSYKKIIKSGVLLFIVLLGFVYTSFTNYLFFHTLAELFTVIIGMSIGIIAINTHKISKTQYFTFLGLSYSFVAGFDILHTLTYEGIGIFDYGLNVTAQLWLIARYIQGISLLVSFLFIKYKFNIRVFMVLYVSASILALSSVFVSESFPITLLDGGGMTRFKVISELIITVFLILSIILMVKFKNFFHKDVYILLICSMITMVISELFFVSYSSIQDDFNMLGHIFKTISFYLLYKSINGINLKQPYKSLFYQLSQYNIELKRKSLQLEIANQKLKVLSLKDSLTGLYNRSYFEEEIKLMEDMDYETLIVLIADLDGLKRVNDTLGHHIGDKYIKESAAILKKTLRSDDILARIGGDEFAIILYDFNENEMEKLVERIRESIEKFNLNFNKFEISISLGWDITRKGEKTVLEVMKKADSNMYADKIKHKNKSSRLSRSLYTS